MFTILLLAAIALVAITWLLQPAFVRRQVAVGNAAIEAQLDSMLASLDANERSYANENRELRRLNRQFARQSASQSDNANVGAKNLSPSSGLEHQSTQQSNPPKPRKPRTPKAQTTAAPIDPTPSEEQKSVSQADSSLSESDPTSTTLTPRLKSTTHRPLPASFTPPRELIQNAKRIAWLPLCKTAITSALTTLLSPIRVIAKSLWSLFARPKLPAPLPEPVEHSIAA